MATSTATLPVFNDTDATYRTWAQGVHTLLTATGWTQTADTGQGDWSTIVRPATSSYSTGRMYRLNDVAQATAPIFMLVEPGNGTVVGRPALRFTLGPGSTGANVINGVPTLGPFTTIVGSTGSAGLTRAAFACGSASAHVLWLGYEAGATTYNQYLVIERWRDGAGAATDTGYHVQYGIGNITDQSVMLGTVNAVRASRTSAPTMPPPVQVSEGADIAVYPPIPTYGKHRPPGLVYVTYFDASIAAGTTFTVSRYGTNRTYRAMGNPTTSWSYGAATSVAPAILYE